MIDFDMWQSIDKAIHQSIDTGSDIDLVFLSDISKPMGFVIQCPNIEEEIVTAGAIDKSPDSMHEAINWAIGDFRAQSLQDHPGFRKSRGLCYTLVTECEVLTEDPMDWILGKDGVAFQWGQIGERSSVFYTPLETRMLRCAKNDVLHRLCCWKAGVPSNLWRKPEGLVWKLTCESYPDLSRQRKS